MLCFRLKEKYGRVFSLKLGSYKVVMAASPDAVHELLVKKSADYAGRQQTYALLSITLGKRSSTLFYNNFNSNSLTYTAT